MKYSSYLEYRISKTQYIQLSNACDEVIRRNLSSKAIVAQDFLHVSRYSPLMSQSYAGFYKNNILSFFVYALCVVRSIIFFIKKIIHSFFYRDLNISNFDKKIDYLFVSHYTGKKNSQVYVDSYFGEIIEKIDTQKFKVAVVYINHTDHKSKKLYKNGQINSFLLNDSIGFLGLVKIYKESLFSLLRFESVDKNIISKKLSIKAQFGLFSPGTVETQIIANHVKNLIATLSPKYLVTTYEGHSWERLCFALAKEAKPLVKCIAYQHAPIFKYQHAIKRGIGESYDPDIILASGAVSEKKLLSYDKLNNSKVLLVGSGRFLPESSKFDKKSPAIDTCLVAPEGTISECIILFSFALECAKKTKSINFIWRFPSQIDIVMLKKQSAVFKALEKNISISDSSLEDDIGNSNYILYRGSSVVIQAVLLGLSPMCFMRDNELSMDPLFLYQENGRVIRDFEDFNKKINDKKIVSKELKAHCRNIYTNIDIKILERIK
ncbi:hypothetical protein BSPWISOX_2930 [uncultured Gammaproteobacteria bacterium]|jgi:hypothetical protein|nr:hypothetical protein BSPWISOX_2930 [uncultured Gammaproteobacteria bacterium]VVM26049.1 hypothetical protein BSPWISOXPB_6741 [uncultured Gammaproteobacteria bacterium]